MFCDTCIPAAVATALNFPNTFLTNATLLSSWTLASLLAAATRDFMMPNLIAWLCVGPEERARDTRSSGWCSGAWSLIGAGANCKLMRIHIVPYIPNMHLSNKLSVKTYGQAKTNLQNMVLELELAWLCVFSYQDCRNKRRRSHRTWRRFPTKPEKCRIW